MQGVENVAENEVRNPAPGRPTSPPEVLQESVWMRVCFAVVVGCFSLWLGCRPDAPGAGNPGDDFLNQKEQEVAVIANLAFLNYNRQNDMLASCPLLEDMDQGNRVWSSSNYGYFSKTGNKTGYLYNMGYPVPYLGSASRFHIKPNKTQQSGVLHLSNKAIVASTCTLGAAALASLLVVLYCRYQRRIRDQENTFLRSIESPIPDVPIVDPLEAIVQEWQDAVEMQRYIQNQGCNQQNAP